MSLISLSILMYPSPVSQTTKLQYKPHTHTLGFRMHNAGAETGPVMCSLMLTTMFDYMMNLFWRVYLFSSVEIVEGG
jgi:hypothetical protein